LTLETSQHQHIAYATKSDEAIVLKLVSNTRGDEVEILEYLHRTSTHDNHIIPFISALRTQNGAIIAMPHLKPLNECDSFSVHTTTVLARYLLEAVRFMHTNGVAHRDLKPENVVVNDVGSQLFVIDYDLAERVDGRDHLVYGYVGTDGFMAPEVRENKWEKSAYSALSADLWATGNLLEYLLLTKCDDPKSPALEMLWWIRNMFMNDDPEKRLSADEALTVLNTQSRDTAPTTSHTVADALDGPQAAPMEWSTRPVSLVAH
jgi:serine/threonine protein kinase